MMAVAITPDEIMADEARWIARHLESGYDRVHLRHTLATESEMREILLAVDPKYRHRLSIHSWPGLADEFPGIGIHLNSRWPSLPAGFAATSRGIVSRACHSIDEVRRSQDCSYVTLSPIFDSISKPGYASPFSVGDLEAISLIAGPKVIALGGVTPDRLPILRQWGFAGYAIYGHRAEQYAPAAR